MRNFNVKNEVEPLFIKLGFNFINSDQLHLTQEEINILNIYNSDIAKKKFLIN